MRSILMSDAYCLASSSVSVAITASVSIARGGLCFDIKALVVVSRLIHRSGIAIEKLGKDARHPCRHLSARRGGPE
jgi:hypothetical protein